jgi:hypothetical protein
MGADESHDGLFCRLPEPPFKVVDKKFRMVIVTEKFESG